MSIDRFFPSKKRFDSWSLPNRIGYTSALFTIVFSIFAIFAYLFPFNYWENNEKYRHSLFEAHWESEAALKTYVSALIDIESVVHEPPLTDAEISRILDDLYVKDLPAIRKFSLFTENNEYALFVAQHTGLERAEYWQWYKYANNEVRIKMIKDETDIFYHFRDFYYKMLESL